MRHFAYPNLWNGCVGAWCPSVDNSRSVRVTDFSRQKNDGTLTNMDPGTDWVASGGKVALDFDGTNDYIQIGSYTAITGFPLSLSCWFNVATTGVNTWLFSIGNDASADNYVVVNVDSSNRYAITTRGGGSVFSLNPGQTITANTWLHICGTVSSAASLTSLYANGVLLGTTSSVATPSAFTTIQMARLVSRGLFGAPKLDDCMIYNRILAAGEVATLALRRGIAYETTRVRRGKIGSAASGNRRRRVILGVNQ